MKSFFAHLSAAFLPGALFIFGLGLSLLLVFGQPQPIKTAVHNSGLYNVLVTDLLAEQGQTAFGSVSIPLGDPQIQQAIESAFTPVVLENAGNQVVDGFYSWIQGKTDRPTTNVDLAGAKDQAAENVATYIAARVATLPTCTTSGLYELYNSGALASTDYYAMTCKPATLVTQTVHDTVKRSILGSSKFSEQVTVDANTITDENGEPLYKKLSFVPAAYKITVWSTYATGALALLSVAGVIFLRPSRRQGAKRAAIILLVIGLSGVVLALITAYASTYMERLITSASGDSTALQVKIAAIARELVTDVRTWWLWIAGSEAVIGVAILVWLRLSKKPVQPVPVDVDAVPQDAPTHDVPHTKIDL